jgi:hypothetical protein
MTKSAANRNKPPPESLTERRQRELQERQQHQKASWANVKESIREEAEEFIKRAKGRLNARWPTRRDQKPDAEPGELLGTLASYILDELIEQPLDVVVGPPMRPISKTQLQRQNAAAKRGELVLLERDDSHLTAVPPFLEKDEWDREMCERSDGAFNLLPGPKAAARELVETALRQEVAYILRQERKRANFEPIGQVHEVEIPERVARSAIAAAGYPEEREASTPPQLETAAQRAARRRSIVDPWLRTAGIVSPQAWATASGENVDKNTPRDYLNGKSKRLRSATREGLAKALGKSAAELPN